MVVLGLWFLKDLLGGIDSIRGIYQNVAFWAHVGGFAAGLAACMYLRYGIEARIEKAEFIAETKTNQRIGYGEGMQGCKELLEKQPKNPDLHLKLARAESRWKPSEEARRHYETAIRILLNIDPRKAAEIFDEYWTKYLTVMEPRYQVSLSRLICKHIDRDLAAKTLRALIDTSQPPDLFMERAYLDLAKIYSQLGRGDLAHYVYNKFLQKFPASRYRQFAEKKVGRGTQMTSLQG
ncbi:MAG: hypothetical protein GTN74_16810 [Proteobacteria bacterium]|nr:hypothetical protein [Pseudomonadota bacterium]NIS72415.1 hypothetical protein [Pseudomonadota bacterium]